MKTYKFDWKDTVTGTIEIEASSAKEAEGKICLLKNCINNLNGTLMEKIDALDLWR
jgi:DNA recombination-dependent growth factor C